MNKTIGVITLVLLFATAGILRARSGTAGDGEESYRVAEVVRGSLEASVSATGNLGAVRTVQVGTQVSGQVAALYADFNDEVTKGQLLARIDPTLAEQGVREAEAALSRAGAEVERAEQEYARALQLHEGQVLTDSELGAARYDHEVAQANRRSAEVSVERARQNLAYTEIYAPIDGIVVERNVDVGQTVAASLSAPQLFLIAQDLGQMQILASVDESDIGSIEVGQAVRFTVQAYADAPFVGVVDQVRLQSATQENVVTYTVVVSVDNPDRRLLPGMTATASFVTGAVDDALLVPNAALRFRPTEAMTAAADPAVGVPARGSVLWTLDGGTVTPVPVRVGLTDGQYSAVSADGLAAGARVVLGVTQSSSGDATSSPFQAQAQSSGPPRPGGF